MVRQLYHRSSAYEKQRCLISVQQVKPLSSKQVLCSELIAPQFSTSQPYGGWLDIERTQGAKLEVEVIYIIHCLVFYKNIQYTRSGRMSRYVLIYTLFHLQSCLFSLNPDLGIFFFFVSAHKYSSCYEVLMNNFLQKIRI